MRIQNNITAMNTHRMYTANNNAISKSAEKLSSGYRINRAGDDAAGLAISEKMRAQVRGLNMASKNSQDANSLIQTAEGALQEVHSMLQRMNELANQSATGTNENFDRTQISAEFDQLKNEINDISSQTNFNNMKLLDGSLASGAAKVDITATSKLQKGVASFGAAQKFTVTDHTGLSSQIGDYAIAVNAANGNAIDVTFTEKDAAGTATGNVKKTTINLAQVTSGDFAKSGSFKVDLSAAGMGTFSISADGSADPTAGTLAAALATTDLSTTAKLSTSDFTPDGNVTDYTGSNSAPEGEYSLSATGTTLTVTDKKGNVATATLEVGGTSIDLSALSFSDGSTVNLGKFTKTAAATTAEQIAALDGTKITAADNGSASGALKIQVGANEGEQLSISVEKMNVDGLGLTDSKIDTQENAGKAISATQDAINLVSEQRATLGAMQNRLEHKISNLDNTSENLSASESRIRDVDIAKEMTSFTKNQILSQAATAMLAQANSMPQNVLSLLQ